MRSRVYDALNRVTQRSYNNNPLTPTVTYTYDNKTYAKGRLTKVSSSVSATEYTSFDVLGRVTGHKQTINSTDYTTAYTYNLAGQLLTETYPSGRMVQNTFASNGDLSQVQTKPSGGSYTNRASSFVYNPAGVVQSLQLGNGKYETTQFNPRLQPTQIGLGTSTTDTSLLKLEYGYGTTTNNGNVSSQKITVPGMTYPLIQSYTYDELNRLANATETSNLTQTWTQVFGYDRYGNRNITSGTGQTNLTFGSTTNRITTSNYSYDSAGNTTADPSGKSFTYDAENKQTKVTSGGGTIGEYWYDGDGKRVKKTTNTGDNVIFIYDAAGKLIEERASSNGALQTSYVYAGGRLLSKETEPATSTTYLTVDHLGSPRINTDSSGNVVARHDYHPFGEEIDGSGGRTTGLGFQADGVRKQFTGYERDAESALDFAQARYFRSSMGRFTSPDPAKMTEERLNDPQHWNLYVYARNNPILLVDISGEFPWKFFVRSFIYNSWVGPVAGDGRGPSLRENASSRVNASFTLDYGSGRIIGTNVFSDPSIVVGVTNAPIVDRSNPRASFSAVSQMGDWKGITMDYAGKFAITPSAMTPDIDVHASVSIKETLTKFGDGVLSVNASIKGDRFPSTEAFVVDQSGKNKVFLGAMFQKGSPFKDLFGDQRNDLIGISFQIKFDKKGNFTAVIFDGNTFSIDEWNKRIEQGF